MMKKTRVKGEMKNPAGNKRDEKYQMKTGKVRMRTKKETATRFFTSCQKEKNLREREEKRETSMSRQKPQRRKIGTKEMPGKKGK